LIIIAIFIVKIDENCYDFLAFWQPWLFSYDLLTTNTSSLVDVEEGRNCEL